MQRNLLCVAETVLGLSLRSGASKTRFNSFNTVDQRRCLCSVNPDETDHNEHIIMSHLIRIDTVCHCYWFLTETPIHKNGCVQIQRWKSPCQKIRDERLYFCCNFFSFSSYCFWWHVHRSRIGTFFQARNIGTFLTSSCKHMLWYLLEVFPWRILIWYQFYCPFKTISLIYFTYIETIVHQRWAKTGEPAEKQPAHL